MQDYPIFKLEPFILDYQFIDDVIETILNVIFFNRALGPIQINQVKCDTLTKIVKLQFGEPQVEEDIKQITSKIKMNMNQFQNSVTNSYKMAFTIIVKFKESEEQDLFMGLFKKKSKIFEEWILQFTLGQLNSEQTTQNLQKYLLLITEIINANYDHFDELFDQSQEKPLKYPYELELQLNNI